MTIKQNLFNFYTSKWDEFEAQLEKNNHYDYFAMPFCYFTPAFYYFTKAFIYLIK